MLWIEFAVEYTGNVRQRLGTYWRKATSMPQLTELELLHVYSRETCESQERTKESI